jgi:hypothetical protein
MVDPARRRVAIAERAAREECRRSHRPTFDSSGEEEHHLRPVLEALDPRDEVPPDREGVDRDVDQHRQEGRGKEEPEHSAVDDQVEDRGVSTGEDVSGPSRVGDDGPHDGSDPDVFRVPTDQVAVLGGEGEAAMGAEGDVGGEERDGGDGDDGPAPTQARETEEPDPEPERGHDERRAGEEGEPEADPE